MQGLALLRLWANTWRVRRRASTLCSRRTTLVAVQQQQGVEQRHRCLVRLSLSLKPIGKYSPPSPCLGQCNHRQYSLKSSNRDAAPMLTCSNRLTSSQSHTGLQNGRSVLKISNVSILDLTSHSTMLLALYTISTKQQGLFTAFSFEVPA